MTSDLLQIPTPIKKVLIIGAECTGKTTLCQDLAHHFNTVWVGEYMRSYLSNKPNNYICQYEDLLAIAIGQIKQENQQAQIANRYLFCDTGLFEIMAYAFWYFKCCPDSIVQAVKQHHYDMVFLTDEKGINWVADGQRDLPHGRADMRGFFIQFLNKFNLSYCDISGNQEKRIKKVIEVLDKT